MEESRPVVTVIKHRIRIQERDFGDNSTGKKRFEVCRVRDLKEGDGGCMAEALAAAAMVFTAVALGILSYATWKRIKRGPGNEVWEAVQKMECLVNMALVG